MELECVEGFFCKRSLENMGKISTEKDGLEGHHSRLREKEN